MGLDYKIEWPGMISNSQVIVSVGPGLTMPEDQIFFKRETWSYKMKIPEKYYNIQNVKYVCMLKI